MEQTTRSKQRFGFNHAVLYVKVFVSNDVFAISN